MFFGPGKEPSWRGGGSFWAGLGGGIITTQPRAPLLDLLLHLYMILMPRCLIFSCISTWSWRCAAWSSLAFLHNFDASLFDLLLHSFMILMLQEGNSIVNPRLVQRCYQWCWGRSVGAVRPNQFLKELAKFFSNKWKTRWNPRTRMLTLMLREKRNLVTFSTGHSCGTPWHDTLIWLTLL